ncbi:MAG TPA: hypothetical protein VHN74_13945 [Candidatus Angelobacter sp.]|jgi:hypothetical protein|nr:hypothetical protein [Candidatus Angelobacter sp.]
MLNVVEKATIQLITSGDFGMAGDVENGVTEGAGTSAGDARPFPFEDDKLRRESIHQRLASRGIMYVELAGGGWTSNAMMHAFDDCKLLVRKTGSGKMVAVAAHGKHERRILPDLEARELVHKWWQE